MRGNGPSGVESWSLSMIQARRQNLWTQMLTRLSRCGGGHLWEPSADWFNWEQGRTQDYELRIGRCEGKERVKCLRDAQYD